VWVASFVFTRCPGPCKSVTATVARLQAELPPDPDLRLITFTVDPARDDPAELRRYADIYKAHPDRWLFLTGDEETVHKLLQERFKQSVGERPGPGVKPGEEFAAHSTRLAVVDRKGVIRATFPGLPDDRAEDPAGEFEDGLKRLKEKVAALLREQ
jgi:cytochrome oxidase Cu insertion factor (SCO1/SenC/PrrC family)